MRLGCVFLVAVLMTLGCQGQRIEHDIWGRLDGLQPGCTDKSPHCEAWAHEYCNPESPFYDYMTDNCRESCGLCGGETRPYPPFDIDPIPFPGPIHQDCSRVSCIMVVCNRDEIRTQNEGECCPRCIPVSNGNPIPHPVPLPVPGPIHQDCSRVRCLMVVCNRDEIRTQNEGECCPRCIAVPNKGCTPVYRQVHLTGANYQGYVCDSQVPLLASSCYGVCASSSVLLFSGKEYSKCQCCKSAHTRTTSALLSCKKPGSWTSTNLLFEYDIILSCSCQTETCPWLGNKAAPGMGAMFAQTEDDSDRAAMDAFGDMFNKVDNYNQ